MWLHVTIVKKPQEMQTSAKVVPDRREKDNKNMWSDFNSSEKKKKKVGKSIITAENSYIPLQKQL